MLDVPSLSHSYFGCESESTPSARGARALVSRPWATSERAHLLPLLGWSGRWLLLLRATCFRFFFLHNRGPSSLAVMSFSQPASVCRSLWMVLCRRMLRCWRNDNQRQSLNKQTTKSATAAHRRRERQTLRAPHLTFSCVLFFASIQLECSAPRPTVDPAWLRIGRGVFDTRPPAPSRQRLSRQPPRCETQRTRWFGAPLHSGVYDQTLDALLCSHKNEGAVVLFYSTRTCFRSLLCRRFSSFQHS